MSGMLSLFRRHLKSCPHRAKGRAHTKCDCPVWCDGLIGGRRVRESLDTISWDRARRRALDREEAAVSPRTRKPVGDAIRAYMASRTLESETARKYNRIARYLAVFAETRGLRTLDAIHLEDLDAYRDARKLSALSWSKELQWLRSFFAFSLRRKWCEENPAKDMEMPPDPKPRPREPYTADEVSRILEACETFGQRPYERARARAMILLMRYYGLRISDVATLRRDRVSNGKIFLHALKNGAAIRLPLYPEVEFALSVTPAPMGAPADCPYFFWTGLGARSGHIYTVERSLKAVFTKSGVERAHAHRFRHTLATEILVSGGTIEDAANILGDSPAVVRKYYAKWSSSYQHRTEELFMRVHGAPSGTSVAHGDSHPANHWKTTGENLAVRVGFENSGKKTQ